MSEKTKENIQSVVGNFFFGQIEENSVFPFPSFTEEQREMSKAINEAVRKFGEDKIDSAKFDEDSHIPEEVMKGLAELGLCGLGVSEEYGGMGLDYSLYSNVFSEVAGLDGSIATTLGASQSIGYRALINEGSEEQKKKWLPRLASGEWLAAFCLTEPSAGSDAYSIKTKATDNGDGTYTITGQKLWITNAGSAEFYTVFCKTDHEIDGKTQQKISCFAVEKSMEGVSFGEKENKMGIRASETRAVYFDKVIVPKENIIGEPGKGFKIAMNVLNSGRLSLGAGCVGGMKTIIDRITKQAKERKQFDRPITDFGLVQEKIADMASLCYAAESMVYLTTGNMVKGMDDYYFETAVCKVFGSECLWEVVDMSLQLAAGNGYMREYPYERLLRDSRINLIFEGTNEILRVFIALSGIRGPGENLKELGKASDVSTFLKDPIKSVGVFTEFAKSRLEKMIPVRSLTMCHEELSSQAADFSSMLSGFAIQVENTLMKYGKDIIGNEMPQGRLANMAIELYAMIAVLSRTTSALENESISKEDKDYCLHMTKVFFKKSQKDFIKNLKRMGSNLDKEMKELSKEVVKREGYKLDIADF